MSQANDLSRSLIPFEQATTLVAVIELSLSSWLICGTVPGVERQPLKKIVPDGTELMRVLDRWRDEAARNGRIIARIVPPRSTAVLSETAETSPTQSVTSICSSLPSAAAWVGRRR